MSASAASSAGIPPLPSEPTLYESDPTSFSNHSDVYTKHLHLTLTADFTSKTLSGQAFLTMRVRTAALAAITLDTSHLDVKAVHLYEDETRDEAGRTPLAFRLGDSHPAFGQPLHIDAPASLAVGSTVVLGITYKTTEGSVGLQWLQPSQTAGKKHPYLFTQFQAIHCRTAVPVQDTPAIKFTYTADITVPSSLVALMSAPHLTATPAHTTAATHTFHFSQPVPIPSYLLALAVGSLQSRRIGPRSSVWSEPETVEAGAYEFGETEEFLSTAESIVGPYVWGTYDILLLPPSFPYGGMENPCLTFVTPTLIAGDRSLASVVCHEASHSWMGNFVGCATWQHFWCNEGLCVFLERKILKALKGPHYYGLDAIVGRQALIDSCSHFGHLHPYTVLNVQLSDIDPDDAFSAVPYEKGFAFLVNLERTVGGEQLMDPFLRAYCQHFAFGTVTSQAFQRFFLDYFKGKVADDKLQAIDWEGWLHAPGLPPDPQFDRTLVDDAELLAKRWVGEGDAMKAQAEHVDLSKWESDQVVMFLQNIKLQFVALHPTPTSTTAPTTDAVSPTTLAPTLTALDSVHHFTQSRNAEIRFAWLSLVVWARLSSLYPAVLAFVTEQGRMKYVRPLYRALYESGGQGRQLAVDTFMEHRSEYHAIAQKMIAKDMKIAE